MKNPYKELSPYIESDANRFKGRTLEIEEMYEGFDRNEFLVCHADSGEGKSSVIEAGLIPKMKKNCYFPIRVIFKSDEHFKNNDVDFDEIICAAIQNEIEKLKDNRGVSVNIVYPQRFENSDDYELSGWEKELIGCFAWLKLRYARITVDNLLYTPVLIFDQFEEVFTTPQSQEWTEKFFAWLQELSTDLCPQRIIKELEKHIGKENFPEINTQKFFKAIFSLRSEYVGKLDYWGLQRHYIPLLKDNRYLLRPLTMKGAKEVITQQDGYDGLNDVADNIIDTLRKMQKGKNFVISKSSELPCIPALFLSLVCSRAFSMSPQERTSFVKSLRTNNDNDESVIYTLIEGFYEDALSKCKIPSKEMGVIEDALVNNEGNRQRISSHADVLKSIDFESQYMEKLGKARLIRIIPEYNREDDSIELVHDALCPVILKRKEQRRLEEERQRENKRMRLFVSKFVGAVFAIVICFVLLYYLHIKDEIHEREMELQSQKYAELETELSNREKEFNESLGKRREEFDDSLRKVSERLFESERRNKNKDRAMERKDAQIASLLQNYISMRQNTSSAPQGMIQRVDSQLNSNIKKADMAYKQRKDQSNSGTPDSLSSKMSQMVEDYMHGK